MELFAKKVNGKKPLLFSQNSSIVDVYLGSKYASAIVYDRTINQDTEQAVNSKKLQQHIYNRENQNFFQALG